MLKVLIWNISNDTSFRDNALKILEQQNDGLEIVGETTTADIAKIDIRGGIILSSASAQKKSA